MKNGAFAVFCLVVFASPVMGQNSTEADATTHNKTTEARNAAIPYYDKGCKLFEKGALKESILLFNKSIEIDPSFPHPYFNRANAREDLNDLTGAHADFDIVIRLMPNFGAAFNGRALVEQEEGDYDHALSDINRAVELTPKRADYYVNRSLIRELRRELPAARADINKALELEPKNKFALEAKTKLGRPIGGVENVTNRMKAPSCTVSETQRNAALPDAATAVSSDGGSTGVAELPPLPSSADLKSRKAATIEYGAGVALTQQGKTNEAIARYTRSIELDASFPHPYMNRGVSRHSIGEYKGAREDFDRVILLMPETPDPYDARAFLEESEGHFDAAIADMNKAIALAPKDAKFYANRGLMHLRKGDLRGCSADVNTALAVDPANKEALWVKARLLNHNTGPFSQSLSQLKAPPVDITKRQRQVTKARPGGGK